MHEFYNDFIKDEIVDTETERKATIDKVLELDCERIAKEMFGRFVKRIDNDVIIAK